MAQVLWRKKANLTQIWPVRNQKWFFFFVEKVLPMNLYYFQWKLFIYWFQRVIHSALQHIYFIYWYNIIIRAWLWSWWRELKIWRNCCRHQQALTIKLLFFFFFLGQLSKHLREVQLTLFNKTSMLEKTVQLAIEWILSGVVTNFWLFIHFFSIFLTVTLLRCSCCRIVLFLIFCFPRSMGGCGLVLVPASHVSFCTM